jgi:acetyl-CoA acyltransferase
MSDAVIVSVARTPIGRAKKGSLRDTRPEYFASEMLKALVARTPGLEPAMVDDVIFGCAMPEGEQGMNVARLITLAAGFPTEVPAMTVNRFCCSGSQTIALAADTIKAGNADIIIAGGVESMSMVEMGGNKMIGYPGLIESNINAYMAMGTTAEVVARRFDISREVQDEFAYNSHRKAVAALEAGKFADEIVPLDVRVRDNGSWREFVFDADEGPRADTTVEGLAKLRPVFDPVGTVTAGNASQINDGAAAVVLMSTEKAQELGLEPIAFVRQWAVAGPVSTRTSWASARPRRSPSCSPRRASSWPTSTSSRSTRPLPASPCTASTSSASTPRRPTSTAEPSRPGIRSAPRGRCSRSRSWARCNAETPSAASSPCVSAVGWGSPTCSNGRSRRTVTEARPDREVGALVSSP